MKKLSPRLAVILGFPVYAVLLFRAVWPEGVTIQSLDYNFGLMSMYHAELPGAFFEGFWRGFPLLGRVGSSPPTLTNLLLAVLPIEGYMDWIYPILLLAASGFLIAFLRLRRLGWIPCMAGALAAFWIGSNLTLIHPGHLLKYGVLVFAAATLFCLEKLHQTRSWRWAVLAGGSLGWMFMHQADVALFFGLVLGAYHLFRTSEEEKKHLPTFGTMTLLLLAVAGLFLWESYRTQMETQVRNVDILQQGTEEEKWDFATQWSFPPSESMDLIAPGYWGWTSTHETVPYHGVTGESAEWRAVGQGLPNLRMESVYVGLLPLGLACLAWGAGRSFRKETLFWTAALVLTLLLSFGKFTPLYGLFFQLPLVNAIRNPNKFLQVFQLCLGILTAIGLQGLLSGLTNKKRTVAAAGFLGISLLLGAGSLFTNADSPAQLAAFADTLWASRAGSLLLTRQLALLHASLLGGWAALCLFAMKRPGWTVPAALGLLGGLLVDGALLSRHYLKPNPTGFLQDNALVEFFEDRLGTERVAFLQSDGISSFFQTHLFPAHHIPFAGIAAAPRLDETYQAYFEALGVNRFRMWQEFGVRFVIAPRSLADQLTTQSSALRTGFREAGSFSLAQSRTGELEILPGTVEQPGNQVILELLLPSDRFMLLGRAIPGTEEESLEAVSNREPPFTLARVQEEEFKPILFSRDPGRITGTLSTPRGFLLQVEVDTPRAFLRLADRYDPSLRAIVNGGEPVPLLQTDALFAGLPLPAGIHEVELTTDLPVAGRAAQALGLLLTTATAVSLALRPKGASRK